MPRMRLVDDRAVVLAALVDQLDDMEPARAAQHGRHLARLHVPHLLGEYSRQPRAGPPAQVASAQGVAGVGESGGDLPELTAAPDLPERLLGAATPGLDLVGAGLFGHQHEDVRELVFGIAGILRLDCRQIMIDFSVAHGQPALDLAFAQALHHELTADVVAILRIGNFFRRQRLLEILRRQLVVLGDALDRALDLRVVDTQARFLRELHQRPLGDQALEHLLLEYVRRRGLHVLLLHLREHDTSGVVHLVLRNRLVVHDRDDAVDRSAPGVARIARCAPAVPAALAGRAQAPRSRSTRARRESKRDLAPTSSSEPKTSGSNWPPCRRPAAALDRSPSNSRKRCAGEHRPDSCQGGRDR